MQQQDNKEELFDRIYQNLADEQEVDQFKKRLKNDKDFRDAFKQYLLINEAVLEDSREQFKEKLDIAKPNKPKQISRRIPRVWAIAATILFLITASFFSYNHFNYWNNILHQYELITDNSTLLNSSPPNNVKATDPLSSNESLMLRGYKLLEQNNYEEAIGVFDQVQVISPQEYDDYFKARYNLAILHLNLKEKEKAKEVLTQINQRQETHFLKDKATELLNQLEKPQFLFFPF